MKGPMKNRKEMVQIRCRYFHLTFERIFSDVPVLRSIILRQNSKFLCVCRERKKERKKTRTGLHECCALQCINKFLHCCVFNRFLSTKLQQRKNWWLFRHRCFDCNLFSFYEILFVKE
jgi:hypothetical protein